MTRFVVSAYPTVHPGLARLETAYETARGVRRGLADGMGLASALLAGMAAAVLVVAYQVMDSLAEGHLLVIWTGAWLAAFAALAALAVPSRQLAAALRQALQDRVQRYRSARADERMWAVACTDSRVMGDLLAASQRDLDASKPVR